MTFLVVDPDGRWPTSWPTRELAGRVAYRRDRISEFPRSRRLFRGEPCWLGPQLPGEKYSRLSVSRLVAEAMGLSWSRRKRAAGHRLSFFVFYGRPPALGTVGQVCGQPLCVNPAHLEDRAAEDDVPAGPVPR